MRLQVGNLRHTYCMFRFVASVLIAVGVTANCCGAAERGVTREEALVALRGAVRFFHGSCSKHGGYVWRYSRDLRLSEGEAETGDSVIWVQPPGTPAVGMALLDAYEATGEKEYLEAAKEAADALVRGQRQSGGWYYSVEFDPAKRATHGYRDNAAFKPSESKKNKTNITTLDDDTTQATVRFLARIDKVLNFKDERIHEAVAFALEALLKAQYPNGGWYQNWDKYPVKAGEEDFPVIRASYPEMWSRKWLNDWTGRYFLNDNVAVNMIETMLFAWEIYGDRRYLESAKRCGDFLILSQMPEPQPAWAQQYDEKMHPVWDRKFEPPAISGGESQAVMEVLMLLYRRTGEARYLEPIPRALAYLRESEVAEGKLARFYELKTNRPLYFTREYELTYDSDDMPTHYAFIVGSRLGRIEVEYRALKENGPGASEPKASSSAGLARQAWEVIEQMDDRGAWIDKRSMRGFEKASPEGVIESATFIRNVQVLCRFIESRS